MRIKAIDIFRAITMLLMIFVNDLWSLSGIPAWLEHSPADVDFLGLADVVFPCFLFVLGMSIPYAIEGRIKKGQTRPVIIRHIILRSAALIIMGLFTVNQPSLNSQASGISFQWFTILMVIAFFLVWNTYNTSIKWKKYLSIGLQIIGILIMGWLAIIFRGNSDNGGELVKFGIQWWGILGLIGWTYFTCALIFLFAGNQKFTITLISFIAFGIINIAGKIWHFDWFIGNGAFHLFSMAGVLATIVFDRYKAFENRKKLSSIFVAGAIVMLAFGLFLRQYFIISKIQATPTWVMLCIGISLLMFLAIYWISDIFKLTKWYRIIEPAGSSTLTCYLLPYICYSVFDMVSPKLPQALTTGMLGLAKSVAFAFLVIGLTSLITRIGIKIKV